MDPSLIRAEMEAMLRSEHFARSSRMSRFLRFVVEASLDGRSHELKETTIGHAVFDRPVDYDPKEDAIVRVEARRLRSRILEYYEGRPAGPVRIVLPKGAYVPDFQAGGLASVLETAAPSPLAPAGQQTPAMPPSRLESSATVAEPAVSAAPPRRLIGSSRRGLWLVASVLVLLALLVALIVPRREALPTEEQMLAGARSFTNLPGFPQHPAFAPSGGAIAFDWSGPAGENLDIYVQRVDGDAPARVTSDPLPESRPVWSPDGTQIAFLRASETEIAIVIHTLAGGEQQEVARLPLRKGDRPRLDWSPDGRSLLSSERDGSDGPHRIVLVDIATGKVSVFIQPEAGILGDSEGAFSPDGKRVAFRRAIRPGVEDVFVADIDGQSLRRITEDNRGIGGLCWSQSGRALIVSSDRRRTGRQLWRFPLDGGEPAQLTPPAMMANSPAVARQGNRMAFVQSYEDRNVYGLDTRKGAAPRLIADSLTRDCDPDLSPDGKTLVFRSDRSGSDDLWAQDLLSGKVRRITRWNGGIVGSAAVSPDGTQVAFNASQGANSSVYVVSIDGGEPRRVSIGDDVHETSPQWSPDGGFLYVSSNRSGSQELWRIPVHGGEARQITIGTGTNGYATADGTRLYYARTMNGPGIYSLRLDGPLPREGTRVLEAPHAFIGHWELGDPHLYHVLPAGRGTATLYEVDPTTLKPVRAIPLPGFPAAYDGGLAITPDGSTVYYTTLDRAGSNIMIAGDPGKAH
ncbi:MAG: hypothetical protein MUF01_06075 [Bryobacterales bacterium]|jgi:Tol biopolymer transport system component|nr:hypothetical protein [Bryobacterales bacterium]